MFMIAIILLVVAVAWSVQAAEVAANSYSLQGPQEGELVKPPSRNVTPNYQSSPLHQTTPLQRQPGKTVPKARYPTNDKPRLFRSPVAKSASEIIIEQRPGNGSGKTTITLAHILLPEASALCWRFDQQLPCQTLGKFALQRFLRHRTIACDWVTTTDQNSQGQKNASTAMCYIGHGILDHQPGTKTKGVQDLAGWLVSRGWVLPSEGHYETQNDLAKREKRGIYAIQKSIQQDSAPDSSNSSSLEIIEHIDPSVSDHVINDEPEETMGPSTLPILMGAEE